jgi:hypothetical protein
MTDILCEGCGYVLNGLPLESRCPECGKPIQESVGHDRTEPTWEQAPRKSAGFLRTTLDVIFRPTQFYRTLAVRGSVEGARKFARVHWWIAAGLFGLTCATHTLWYGFIMSAMRSPLREPRVMTMYGGAIVVLSVATYFALDGITRLAAKLTNWEATYRGIRLPYDIVLRGMYYHAAHYLPVALAAFITVMGYQILLALGLLSLTTATAYLYVLSAEVIISAAYLFNTYWIGMRNMMYANR